MSIQKETAEQIKLFFELKTCSFPGWQQLQTNYKRAKSNLGSGCAPCRRNAVKRKFSSKIIKLMKLKHARKKGKLSR